MNETKEELWREFAKLAYEFCEADNIRDLAHRMWEAAGASKQSPEYWKLKDAEKAASTTKRAMREAHRRLK